MKHELLGRCPCCFNSSKRGANVDIYAAYDNNGALNHMYIFGDDDFDVAGDNAIITKIQLSKNWNKVEEIVCPRCHERVAVDVPLYKEQKTSSEEKSSQANFQEQQR